MQKRISNKRYAVIGPVAKDRIEFKNSITDQAGGIPFYLGLALKSLGSNVEAFLTYGRKDHKFFKKEFTGIKINYIPTKKTLIVKHEVEDNPDFRKITSNYAFNRITPENITSNLESFDVLCLGPLFYENISKEFFEYYSNKILVLNNFGMFNYLINGEWVYKNQEKFIELMKYVNFLILDEEEVKFVTGKKTSEEAVRLLQKNGLKNAAITNASKGSKLFIGKKIYKIPAFKPRRILDPTGAGDTYVAGLIKGIEMFKNPQKVGEFAAMVATIKLERRGPFNKTTKDVLDRLGWSFN